MRVTQVQTRPTIPATTARRTRLRIRATTAHRIRATIPQTIRAAITRRTPATTVRQIQAIIAHPTNRIAHAGVRGKSRNGTGEFTSRFHSNARKENT